MSKFFLPPTVLSIDGDNSTKSDELLEYCGANFCNSRNLTNITGDGSVDSPLERPDEGKIQMLTGILLGFALLSSLITALLVDPLSRYYRTLYDFDYFINVLHI